MTDFVAHYEFETDPAGQAPSSWSSTAPPWFINSGATPTVVSTTSFTGKQCLQIVTPASPNLTGTTVSLGILPAGTYHVGAYCKGNVGGEHVDLYGGQPNATGSGSNIILTTTWTRYKFTFTTDGTVACYFAIRVDDLSPARTFFIDAVQIVSGPALPGYILFGWNAGSDVTDLPIGVTESDSALRYVWATNSIDSRALTNVTQTQRNAATAYLNDAHTGKPQNFDLTFTCASGYQGVVSVYCVDWDENNRAQTVRIDGKTHTVTNFVGGHWVQETVNVPPNGQLPITVQPIDPNTVNAVVSGVFFGGIDTPGWQPINTVNQGDAAQGDLSGVYPNPTVTKVLGGQTPISASTVLGGELSGTLPNPALATSRTTLTGIAQSANFTAIPGNINYCTASMVCTLPAVPVADSEVAIYATNGTVIMNPSGTDKIAEYGLTRSSPSTATISNPGFETNTTGWSTTTPSWFINTGATITRDTTKFFAGIASGRIDTTAASNYQGAVLSLGVLPAGKYVCSAAMIGNVGGERIQLIMGAPNDSAAYTYATLTTTWQTVFGTFTADGVSTIYVGAGDIDPAVIMRFWVDNFVVQTATTQVSSGYDITLKYLSGTWYTVKDSRPIATPCFMALRASQSITAATGGVYVKVLLDNVNTHAGGSLDPWYQCDFVNHRFIAATPGVYMVHLFMRWDVTPPGNNYVACIVFKNSTNIATANGYWGPWGDVGPSTTGGGSMGRTMVPMNAGDYLEFVIWHNSGTNWSIQAGSDNTHMMVHKIA